MPSRIRDSRRSPAAIAANDTVRRIYALVSEDPCSHPVSAASRVGSPTAVLAATTIADGNSPWSMGTTSGSLRRLG